LQWIVTAKRAKDFFAVECHCQSSFSLSCSGSLLPKELNTFIRLGLALIAEEEEEDAYISPATSG
jgi:hypothetical protein